MSDERPQRNDATGGDDESVPEIEFTMPHSTDTWKVLGETDASDGIGVLGHATSTTGETSGVQGVTDSTAFDAAGVRGTATGASGRVYGVYGSTPAADISEPAGVYGEATALTGSNHGVHGYTNSTNINAAGVRAEAQSAQGLFAESKEYTGAACVTEDGAQTGVFGINNADTSPGGTGYGVRGVTDSLGTESAGVYGDATATTGQVHGVRGTTSSPGAPGDEPAGVRGAATATTGVADGVHGTTDGRGVVTLSATRYFASGVRGEATATSGVTVTTGVYGTNQSTSGTGHGVVGNSNSKSPAAAGVYALGGVNANDAAAISARGRVDVRDHGGMAYLTSDQEISDGAGDVTVAFDQVDREDFGGFSAAASTGVYKVQTAGDYAVEWQIDWSSSFSSLTVYYGLVIDGSSNSPGFAVEHTEDGLAVRNFNKTLFGLDIGQTIEVTVQQNSGSSKFVEGYTDFHDTFLSIRKVG